MATAALAELCAVLGWQGGTIHDALLEVKRLRDREAKLEADLRQANYEIGGLKAEQRIDRAIAADVAAERDRLRAVMLARLTAQETLPATATVEQLWQAIEMTNERLGEALYPTEETTRAA